MNRFKVTSYDLDRNLYLVQALNDLGKPTEDVALFRWIDASMAKPPSGKTLDFHMFIEAYEMADGQLDFDKLLGVLRVCFDEALKLTYNLSDKHVCKFLCHSRIVHSACNNFAMELEETGNYLIKRYSNWIEIWKINTETDILT